MYNEIYKIKITEYKEGELIGIKKEQITCK